MFKSISIISIFTLVTAIPYVTLAKPQGALPGLNGSDGPTLDLGGGVSDVISTPSNYNPDGNYFFSFSFLPSDKNGAREYSIRYMPTRRDDYKFIFTQQYENSTKVNTLTTVEFVPLWCTVPQSFSYTIPAEFFDTPGKISTFTLDVYHTWAKVNSYSIVTGRPGITTINPFSYDGQTYTAKIKKYAIDDTGKQTTEAETISFSNLTHIIEYDHYNCLNLSSISMKVKLFSIYSPISTYPTIQVLDPTCKMAENMGLGHIPSFSIPLQANMEVGRESKFTLSFGGSLYVNPDNMKMSFGYKEGYVITDKLYFPMNMESKDISLHFNIPNIGTNNITMDFYVVYYASKTTFGTCSNAKYCVITTPGMMVTGDEEVVIKR